MGDEQHPQWCAVGVGRCGTHLASPVSIPATAGRWRIDDDGAAFPRVELAAAQTGADAPAVHLAVIDPTGEQASWASGLLTEAQLRALLAAGADLLNLISPQVTGDAP